jgi:hypothetical protein
MTGTWPVYFVKMLRDSSRRWSSVFSRLYRDCVIGKMAFSLSAESEDDTAIVGETGQAVENLTVAQLP